MNEVCLLVVYGLLLWLEHLDGLAEVIVVWVMFGVVVFVNVFDFSVLLILKTAECNRKCKARKREKKKFE